jgi:hypothetical protein
VLVGRNQGNVASHAKHLHRSSWCIRPAKPIGHRHGTVQAAASVAKQGGWSIFGMLGEWLT